MSKELPVVDGRMECSIATFERRCRLAIDQEQGRSNPDTHLIAILCDAIRLGREYAEAMPKGWR